MRIIVIEDELELANILAKRLKNEGYGVDVCDNGLDAEDYIKSSSYDLILLDLMLPKQDGFTLLQKIRKLNITTPVLLLTARDSIEDRVKGLDMGANDYVIKPFSFDELMARIRVLFRNKNNVTNNELKLGDLVMNVTTHQVVREGKQIQLSAKEFAILEYMLYNKGVVLSRDRIEEHVWNYDFEGGSNVVDVYMRYLRKKIDDPFEKKYIHTIRGVGYIIKDGE